MSYLLNHLKSFDWALAIMSFVLVGIGLIFIYSSSVGDGDFFNFYKQLIFFGVGVLVMFIISLFDWRTLKEDPYFILLFYFACVFLLLGLILFAPETRGIRGWYKIGPVSFDPIEITKIVLIILLAKYFSKRHVEMYRFRHVLFSGVYVLIPAFLVFIQPDLGSVLILLSLWIGVLLISGIKRKHFLILCIFAIILAILCWSFLLKDYQKDRITSFLYPIDPLGSAWSQNQSKIAIGSGGLIGQGITKGSQTQYGFLPEPQTDFIYSTIAEESGLIGVSVLFGAFLLLIWRVIKIAYSSASNFAKLFACGFVITLIAQIFIHIGMNLGLLPIIGIPMPFISYGGGGLIMCFIGLGVLQSIKTH